MTLLFGLFIAALGAMLASFVGVIAERMHTGSSWGNDRSRCDACSVTLAPRDLIPVFSWLIARGRCRSCGSKIPVRHVVLEGVVALAFFSAYVIHGLSAPLVLLLAALLVLLFVVLYDMRHTIVPMRPVVAFVVLALVYRVALAPSTLSIGLALMVAGSAALVFLAFYLFSRGRVMGLGDTPVVLGLSILTGPASVIPGVLFSFWIGALYGVVVLASTRPGHRMGIEVPFVPFLALGFLLAYFTGWNPLPLF
jgi:prepilin signal peptidase PulO-like enzyme (type II secretory pathway)